MKISQAALLFLSVSSPLSVSARTAFVPSSCHHYGLFVSAPGGRAAFHLSSHGPSQLVRVHAKLRGGEEASHGTTPDDATRRQLLGGTLPLLSIPPSPAFADKEEDFVKHVPLADVPMIRLRLPKSAVGREYVVIPLKVKGQGPFDFMVDSGLTTEMITPHLQRTLGIDVGKSIVKGLAAGGDTSGGALVELSDVSLCCGKFAKAGAEEFRLPLLHAVVSDFPQEHIDPAHDPVEGMLGMEMLALFDVDFDFPAGRIRFWAPGTAADEARKKGLVEILAAVLNETLLLGIRVTSAQSPETQPMVGILDCGATFSAVNWVGAELLGLPPKDDKRAYSNVPTILGVGIDGRPMYLPTQDVQFTFVGELMKDQSGIAKFAPPPKPWQPWDSVKVGVGDLPIFSLGLGDGVRPFQGPAALIGLDVLSQRRLIMEAGGAGRRRRLFVSPK